MFHYSQGIHTTQGHKGIPEGFYEEEQGRKGFSGPVSHLIKKNPSTRWKNIEGPLGPHLYDGVELPRSFGVWQRMFYNSDVGIYTFWLTPQGNSQIQADRNADGDTLFFCHKGSGDILTEYGLLKYTPGTYVCIPKCVTYAWVPKEETCLFVIESRTSGYREPDRGMVGRNAFYDTEAIVRPQLESMNTQMLEQNLNPLVISVKKNNLITRFTYGENVFDTVGWKGDFFPFTLHIKDMMPMLSARVHLPPSAHATFVAHGFVVCTFLPRPLESDADALKVPFYHQNIDYDEVLFYHAGNFFSRDNLHAGMMTLHPAGFPHGPHPKAIKNVGDKTHTDEVAVMVDTWQSLQIDNSMERVEVKSYWQSWMK